MKLVRVGWQLAEGVRALANMLDMLFKAGLACRVPAKGSGDSEYVGVSLDGSKYWIGLGYADPEKLVFVTRGRIDPAAAVRLSEGELTEENRVPGRYRWWRRAELTSETVHFFERSKVSQMLWLEEFLRECLTMARSIELPDQPPIPEEPDES